MNLFYCTYFDHIKRAGYRPDVIVENWLGCNKRVVFGANQQEIDVMVNQGVNAELIDIGVGVSYPPDIANAQNACVNYCFDILGADWLVYMQGDQYLTLVGDTYLAERIREISDHPNIYTISVMCVALYSYMWNHQTTITISHKETRIIYDMTGDGANCNTYNPMVSDGNNLFLDIGYLGLPQYYGKMVNHKEIWKDGDPYKSHWLKVYSRDVDEAVRMAYKSIAKVKQRSIEPIDFSIYEDIINRLQLREDYIYCKSIMDNILG